MDYYSEQRYKQTSTQYRWGWDESPVWAVLPGTNTQVPGYTGGVEKGSKFCTETTGPMVSLTGSQPIMLLTNNFPELSDYPFDKNYSNHR